MIELIKECRGGLATNFSLFNIMALYSLIQYTSTVITEYYYGYPADLQYLYWDIACNFFFFLTIGYTSCASRLSELRPNDRLFSFSNMFCVISLFLIQLVGQFLVIILMAGGTIFTSILQYYTYAGTDVNLLAYQVEEDFVTNTYEVQSLFMFSNFMYIFTVMAFTIGSPWKRFFGTNPFFMIVLVFVMTYSILICVVPKARLGKFELQEFDMRWQGMLLGLGFAFGIYMYVLQKFVL
jgi:magnesium-transporting ATPase (P-type)